MKLRVTKQFDFETAHALDHHDGKCHNIHGHTYHLEVVFSGAPINQPGSPKDGMVIDFTDIKQIVKVNVVDVFDHALVLRDNSRFLGVIDHDLNPKLLLKPYQPTCEMMLLDMVKIIKRNMQHLDGVELERVMLRETQSSYAEWLATDNA